MYQIPFTPPESQYKSNPIYSTFPSLFSVMAQKLPTHKCLGTRSYHTNGRGAYRWYSYSDILQMATALQKNLQFLAETNKYIGILSQNRTEWTVLDIAAAGLGLVTVPLYDTQSNEDCEHILTKTELKVIFCEAEKAEKFTEIFTKFNVKVFIFDDGYREREWFSTQKFDFKLPDTLQIQLKADNEFSDKIYQIEPKPTYNVPSTPEIYSTTYNVVLGDFYKKINLSEDFCKLISGTFHSLLEFDPEAKYINQVDENQVYTLVFTSGTTSLPKSVVLTHKNFMAVAQSMQKQCLLEKEDFQDYMISYMPLAHIYMRVLQAVAFLQEGAQGYISSTPKTLLEDIQACAPTALFLVPRVVQKIYEGVLNKIKNSYLPIRLLFKLCHNMRISTYEKEAISIQMQHDTRRLSRDFLDEEFKTLHGKAFDLEEVLDSLKCHPKQISFMRDFYQTHLKFDKTPPTKTTRTKSLFNFSSVTNLVFSKISALTGGRVRGAVSGSAAIQQNQGQFFRICFNCKLFQGYGLSETAAGGTVQSYYSSNFAGVGSPLSSDVKIWLKSTSEYKIDDYPFPRGEIIISGDNVFKAYLETEGDDQTQFSTADIGQFNFITGELEIIDRIKNIIKLSQGEFVQLGNIENTLIKHNSVENCFVCAQTWMKWVICVISLNKTYLKYSFPQYYDRQLNIEEYNELCKLMQEKLKNFCSKKGLRGFCVPKYFIIDFGEWSPENNMLTSAFKVKRGSCSEKYGRLCEEIYHTIDAEKEVNIGSMIGEFGLKLNVDEE